jgi:hypothetical protein
VTPLRFTTSDSSNNFALLVLNILAIDPSLRTHHTSPISRPSGSLAATPI